MLNCVRSLPPLAPALALLAILCSGPTSSGQQVQARINADCDSDRPLVVHVVVALCDNLNQGIASVPERLGNGKDPKENLYWGAAYGVRNYLTRKAGWDMLTSGDIQQDGVLDSLILHTTLEVHGKDRDVYLVAEAWDGSKIREATERFLKLASGHDVATAQVERRGKSIKLSIGGAAHIIAYVGHNGLMDFSLENVPEARADAKPRSSIVLACASKEYFLEHLRRGGSCPLVLTTGRMAPEAYTLDAAVRPWLSSASADEVHESAAMAYDRFQKCGRAGARRLFWVDQSPGK